MEKPKGTIYIEKSMADLAWKTLQLLPENRPEKLEDKVLNFFAKLTEECNDLLKQKGE